MEGITAAAPVRLTVVMPVFNDWQSAILVIDELAAALAADAVVVDIVAVDDCSTEPPPPALAATAPIRSVQVLHLSANVGHQRAIAVGLMSVAERAATDLVAVMDADGEDQPTELRRLLAAAVARPGVTVLAQRARRSEGPVFRLFYRLYVRLFRVLTGQRISFGNFSVLPAAHVRRIVANPQIWNHFAATVIQSRLPTHYVPTTRGRRHAGRSRMNFVGLIGHGLGAMSVFSDAVFVRILIASATLLLLSVGTGIAVLAIRLLTTLAIPGWTTTALGFALLVSIQAIMTPITVAFLLLSNRSVIQPLPRTVALSLIAAETDLLDRSVAVAARTP